MLNIWFFIIVFIPGNARCTRMDTQSAASDRLTRTQLFIACVCNWFNDCYVSFNQLRPDENHDITNTHLGHFHWQYLHEGNCLSDGTILSYRSCMMHAFILIYFHCIDKETWTVQEIKHCSFPFARNSVFHTLKVIPTNINVCSLLSWTALKWRKDYFIILRVSDPFRLRFRSYILKKKFHRYNKARLYDKGNFSKRTLLTTILLK